MIFFNVYIILTSSQSWENPLGIWITQFIIIIANAQWIDGEVDGWVDRWVSAWIEGGMEGGVDGQTDR